MAPATAQGQSPTAARPAPARAAPTLCPPQRTLPPTRPRSICAEADLIVARQDLAAGVLTTPISGTIAAVAITKGDSVSANSGSTTITVIGSGQYTVDSTVTLTMIDKVKVGDTASVTVNGRTEPITGTVTQIGILSDSSSSSTPTYPVTVLLKPAGTTLYNGSGAIVTVTVGNSNGVLTVPTSAITTVGSRHTVTTVANGVSAVVPVEIGAMGTDLTEITSGLKAGQSVVIADLAQALPTAGNSNRQRTGTAACSAATAAGQASVPAAAPASGSAVGSG